MNKQIKLVVVLSIVAAGFILGGVWTRWLLADRLFQTGAVFAVLSLFAWGMVAAGKEKYDE